MDLFGLITPSELSTPVGVFVKSATQSLLLGPDWSKNMEVCDRINSFNEGADALRAIQRQLQDSDPNVVQLALVLAEACLENCESVPGLVRKQFMDEIVGISQGKKGTQNQEKALELIQHWGKKFETRRNEIPVFYDTYVRLKLKGERFPIGEATEAAPAPRAAKQQSSSQETAAIARQEVDKNAKLLEDLSTVLDKVRLCREMLPESPGIQADEALAEVIGFLEACRDRMIDLIEAGTNGLLNEATFALCLRVNDALLRTLEAEKNGLPISASDSDAQFVIPSSASCSMKVTGDSNTQSKQGNFDGLKASMIDGDDDENDVFASLAMKNANTKKKPAPVKIAPPPGSTSASLSTGSAAGANPLLDTSAVLLPPPPPGPSTGPSNASGSGSGSGGPKAGSSSLDIMDFLSAPVSSEPPKSAASSQQSTKASIDDELTNLFQTTGPPTTDRPAVSSGMSDEEFESFLNNVGGSK